MTKLLTMLFTFLSPTQPRLGYGTSMVKMLFVLLVIAVQSSCTFTQKPEFKKITRIDVSEMNLNTVTLSADAVFENPNSVKGKLTIEELHVVVDQVDVGKISYETFDVPAKAEFTIPLTGQFSLAQLYGQQKKGILGTLVNVLTTDSLAIQYKGKIRYHLGDFSFPYAIDEIQHVRLK